MKEVFVFVKIHDITMRKISLERRDFVLIRKVVSNLKFTKSTKSNKVTGRI